MTFRNKIGKDVFEHKYMYREGGCGTWNELCEVLVHRVCSKYMTKVDMSKLTTYMKEMKFIPGGRYLYYAGRDAKFYNNCFTMIAEDTREGWAELSYKHFLGLMCGGGIGTYYGNIRPAGRSIAKTGGEASGPIPLMNAMNEIGRNVKQGGSRRSALYASLPWDHNDIDKFLSTKDWDEITRNMKANDFNYPAALDMTNISVSYNTKWLEGNDDRVFLKNIRQACKTSEPGFAFNFYDDELDVGRNAPVSGDTHILTSNGYKKIVNIVNKEISIWTGQQWTTTTFKKTKEDVDIINVEMTGRRIIKAEKTHPFMVEEWKGRGKRRKLIEIKRVEAQNLKVGDILNVSMPVCELEDFDSRGYTLGFAYGDGHFDKKGGGEITLCSDNKKELLKYFNENMFSSINEKTKDNYIRCYFKQKMFNDDGTRRAKDLYPTDKNISKMSFLAGLFDADGYTAKGRLSLSSIHKSFLEDVRRELESFGILSSINVGSVGGYTGKTQSFSLVVMSEYITEFKKLIPTKRLKIEDHESYRKSTIKVTKLSSGKKEDVYCCDVGVDEHTFMAEGVIISNCTEITSMFDSDVCNLGSVNMSRIDDVDEFIEVCELANKFLICGTLEAELPYEKVEIVRNMSRKIGLGLMGVHEWLIKRNYKYEVVNELKDWLIEYQNTEIAADEFVSELGITPLVKYRAIAPTGTLSILAGTTGGIEPIFAKGTKRRYLKGTEWIEEIYPDPTVKFMVDNYNTNPNEIESSMDLAKDVERRIKFQADIQEYVDMAISSTVNLPEWGSEQNNEDTIEEIARLVRKYASRLRGITFYADGSRGGQPLTEIPYEEATNYEGINNEEQISFMEETSCKSGVCGI